MSTDKYTFDPDDARLTAYALGELDAADVAEVEALLQESAEARAFVEQLRVTAEELAYGFAATANDSATLTTEQHKSLDREFDTAMPQPRVVRFSPWALAKVALPVAAAAAIVVTMMLPTEPVPLVEPTNVMPTETIAGDGVRRLGYTVQRESEQTANQSLAVDPQTLALQIEPLTEIRDLTPSPPPPTPKQKPTPATQPSADYTKPAITQAAGKPTSPHNPSIVVGEQLRGIELDAAKPNERYAAGAYMITGNDLYAYYDAAGVRSRAPARGKNAVNFGTEAEVQRDNFGRQWYCVNESAEAWRCNPNFNTEAYAHIVDNPFLVSADNPLSTFSIDVDTASYANVRRFINSGQLPPPDAVRIEELINYFDYSYPLPEGAGETPFSVNVDVATCPWQPNHQLMRIGLKGWEIPTEERPPANLVFLIDVSGSMKSANKLPLLKSALGMLASTLNPDDRVAMVVYAGASGLVLPSTTAENAETIRFALDKLEAGGSTNGGAGIELAYKTATANFIKGGINRVILATDGDFNVGTTNQGELIRKIEEKAKTGVFLTVLGFGMGNYKDDTLEKLANKGNGNYAYIDTAAEAQKVLVQEVGSTLMTIAKDVKIQIEFNPLVVGAYRLIGYENRLLAARDFNDDTKDAGEIGSGHTVTALYEVVPTGFESNLPQADGTTGESPTVDPLKYQIPQQTTAAAESGELATIKLRYKQPDEDTSSLIEFPIAGSDMAYVDATADFKFAASVASFGMLLRGSPYRGEASFASVLELAATGLGEDVHGYRAAFIELVAKAAALKQPKEEAPGQPVPLPMPAPQEPAATTTR